MTIDEIIQLAGVAAITIVTGQLDELASTYRPQDEVESLSLFRGKVDSMEKMSYAGDEEKFRSAFSAFSEKRAEANTKDVSYYLIRKLREQNSSDSRQLRSFVNIKIKQRL